MPRWIRKDDGTWEAADTAAIGAQPILRGITQGQPPACRISVAQKPQCRFDAPTDEEIKRAQAEDVVDQGQHFEDSFYQAKKDLASGKLKVHPDALRASRREVVQDGDREVIVPAYMAPVVKMVEPALPPGTPEFKLEPPRNANPLPGDPTTTLKGQIRRGFNAIMNSDGSSHLRRTY